MQNEYTKLDDRQKYLINTLSIFGNEKTNISTIFDYFFEKEEHEELFDIMFDFRDSGWLEIEQNKYILSEKAERFIFETEPPTVHNTVPIIEYFSSKLMIPFNKKIENELEFLLLKYFSRVSGISKILAILYDSYGQYLSFFENNKSAVNFYNLAIQTFEDLDVKNVRFCDFYNHLADSYLQQKEYEQSLSAAFQAAHIAYTLHPKDIVVLIYTFSIISKVYMKQKKYKLAYDYNLKSIKITEKYINDNNLLSVLFFEASLAAYKNDMLEEAKSFLDKSLIKAQKISIQKQNHELIEKIKLQKHYMSLVKNINISVMKLTSWKTVVVLVLIIAVSFFLAYMFLN